MDTKNNYLHTALRYAMIISIAYLTSCSTGTGDKAANKQTPSSQTTADIASTPSFVCQANNSWVTAPNPPQEIPGGGTDFCQFYQFSWQWFLYLVSPSQTAELRNFQVWEDFPVLQASGDSCTTQPASNVLFVRTVKDKDAAGEFVIPERIDQAGRNQATIYDQNGNVAFYDIRFNRGMCSAPTTGNLPAGSTELKTAWRIITDAEKSDYFWINAEISGVSTQPQLLGLIGFHLIRSTVDHPEFMWASFEHKNNAPDCYAAADASTTWSFTSQSCASKCLPLSASNPAECASNCQFNAATTNTSLTGTATEICRVYADATKAGDHKADENKAIIDTLNSQIVGKTGFLAALPSTNPMAVFKNYFNIGGLWINDPTVNASSDTSQQRGSLQLANSVMETTFQGDISNPASPGNARNCFVCHSYTPGQSTQTSHIFSEINGNSQ